MLHIDDLSVAIDGRQILDRLNLDVAAGEVHAIMGPNGAGKSTLSNVLAGRDGYEVSGTVTLDGIDLLGMTPEQRAVAGLFLAFQYPVEIPGVGNMYFLHTVVNTVRRARGEPEMGAGDFLALAKEHMARLDMSPDLLTRAVNDGFSGGEKKRNEILQLALLEPRLAVLDETDSGLDIDALRVVADGVARLRDPSRATIVITHYPRLLEHLHPDRVHVLSEGRIVRSGDHSLAHDLEEHGYAGVAGGAR
jgi:Fe-S cluster assembly ATP-binding protein